MNKIISDIKNNSYKYGSIPFWSWDDKLSPDELRRQIRVMHDEQGMRGFFMHARGGLETEYLGEEWFECVDACVDEAEKLGMEAWAYDENGWPSGFAGGILLKDKENLAEYLTYKKTDKYDAEAYAVYVLRDNILIKVSAEDVAEYNEFHCVYNHKDEAYVDTMDGTVIKKFIDETHELYKEKAGGKFSKNMPGFFTDEPQYYRWQTPWSKTIPEKFRERYGYDVTDGLAALFVDCEGAGKFRYDYYLLCHTLFLINFGKQLYDWHENNGCQLTGHYVEESYLGGQMWCCGGVMPFYEYEHIPGIDHLGRYTSEDVAPKQLGSVVSQLGKEFAISEMFGCAGWDVNPIELRWIAEYQYAAGINRMCQHLAPYSIRGQRKRDYPAFYSAHSTWYKSMKEFDLYFDRLGCALSLGKEKVNTLVIHPMHSVYMVYKRAEDYASAAELEESLKEVTNYLSRHQVSYHYGDEILMQKYASVKDGKMVVGNCIYDYVVFPALYTLDGSTAELIKEYVAQGGKLCSMGTVPTCINGLESDMSWLNFNTGKEEIVASSFVKSNMDDLRVMVRDVDGENVFYLGNKSLSAYDNVEVILENCKYVALVDLETLSTYKAKKVEFTDDSVCLTLDFEPAQSYVVVTVSEEEYATLQVVPQKNSAITFDKSFGFTEFPDNKYTMDRLQISYDGVNYELERPIEWTRDLLLKRRYEGDLYMKFTFDVKEIPENARLVIEPMDYKAITLNGESLTFAETGDVDFCNLGCEVSEVLKEGKNELVMKVYYYQDELVYDVLFGGYMESLRNCLNFQTEIECVYLIGKFELETDNDKMEVNGNCYEYTGGFAVKKPTKDVDFSDIVRQGYPFFAGKFTVENEFDWNGESDNTDLVLKGNFSVVDVYVNAEFAGKMMFSHRLALKDFLQKGTNTITLDVYTSNRNLLGPHHFVEVEPGGVGPYNFSFENSWEEDKMCDLFRERYAFVKFGFVADK